MVDGADLICCDAKKLEELDVRRKHRSMILKGIEQLREKWVGASNEVSDMKQIDEPIISFAGNNTRSFLEVKETKQNEVPVSATIRKEQSIPCTIAVKPRGQAADAKEEVSTFTKAKTTLPPKRDLWNGWEFVSDV